MAQTFTLKYFNGGLSDWEDKGIRGAFKNGRGLSIRRRKDSLYANQALVTADNGTPVVVDLIRFTVPASDGNTYLFGASKIYKQTSGGTVSVVYTDSDGQISGAEEMWLANGKKYIFWFTSTKVKCKEIPGNPDWTVDTNADVTGLPGDPSTQTYPKTNLTAQEWHTAAVANGALMICNGNYLAMVGWDGSYTNEALRLNPDMVAKTLIDRNDYVVIAAGTLSGRQNAALYEWESGSLNYLKKKRIPASKINALIDSEIMLMQGDTVGNIFFSDFVTFLPVTSFPAGGQVNPGAITDLDGVVYFGVYGSNDSTRDGIYSYGRNKKNGDFALNFEYPIVCTEIGALEVINNVLHASYKLTVDVTTTYHWVKVDSAIKQDAVYESLDLAAPTKPDLEATTWLDIRVHCAALPAGTKIGVKYRVDKSAAWVTAYLDGDIEFLEVDDAVFATFTAGAVGDIFEVQVSTFHAGNLTPEVFSVKPTFE